MTSRIAPRGPLPDSAEPYRTIGPFDAASLPAGLRARHSLKPGAWGLIRLAEGRLSFVWEDDQGGVDEIVAPAEFVVPPEAPHHVEADGPFELTITFHRAA